MKEDNNKRQYPRLESLNLVSVQHFNKNEVVDAQAVGRTLDLSEGGLKLEVTTSLPLFSRITMTLGLKENFIQVQGEVVFLSVVDENKIHMGLRFIELSEKNKEKIKSYLAANTA